MLAIDTETFLIQRDRPFPPVVCLSWAANFGAFRNGVLPHTAVEDFIVRKLADPTQHFCGHNIGYDMGVIAASWPDLLPRIFDAYKAGRITDTQIRQQLIDIALGRVMADDRLRGYRLTDLYEAIFEEKIPGPGADKSAPAHVRYRFGELYNVDFTDWPEDSLTYAREDAIAPLKIYEEQEAKAGHLLRDDAFQAYSAFVLQLITAKGMRTDPGRVQALKARKLAEASALEPELIKEGMLVPKYAGRGKNKHKTGELTKKVAPAQARIQAVCKAKGIEVMMTKPTNPNATPQISIDRTACIWADDPLMLRRADYVSAEKILTTYIPVLEQGYELPITSRYGLAATGRTTASAPSPPLVGTNLQNAPRAPGVRECYVPREGKVFMLGDFAGAELHTLAQACKRRVGFSVLGDTLNAGRDAHINMARYLLGGALTPLDYDDLALRRKQGDPEAEKSRQEAKAINFALGGFMHPPTFVKTQLREGNRWTLEAATAAREAWLTAYPEMPLYFESCKLELGAKHCTVEFHWSKRLRRVRGMPTICNGFFQAPAADGAKKAINEVVRVSLCEQESYMYMANTYGVNMVHDELICEIDEAVGIDHLQDVAGEFKRIMQDEFNELVPDYPTSVEVVFARYWSKAAKPVFDDQGRLIPWNG